jgi:2',3'-cyclic-nucleotide 2'-phosphodiesterase (5'-nucleotidase family)
MLPFANTLMTVDVSGAELLAVVEHGISSCRVKGSCYPAVGGLSYETTPNSINIELFDGTELDPEATYTVVVTDYMFFGGSGYPFAPRSCGGAFTGINWRTPVVEWTRRLETSSTNPLEDHLDPVARNR